jgi:hypothetical protein
VGLGFLTPLFLAGLALLAIPVIMHLRRRHTSRVQAFPSLMFLRQIQQSTMRRRRIRHWSLLALRSLALAALVIAFARPLFRGDAIAADRGSTGREVIVLLDNSWSMGFEDRFARAKEAAAQRFASLGPGDSATLIVFSDQARVEAQAVGDSEQLGQIVAETTIDPHGTRFAPALKLARKAVLDSRLPSREVVLISDFQRIGWERGEDLRLPPGTEITWVDLSSGKDAAAPSNLAVAGLVLDRSLDGERERVVAQARVTRRGGEGPTTASLALELGGREVGRREVELLPDASTLVAFEPFSLPQGISRGRVILTGDSLAPDNEYVFVLSRAQALPVVLIDDGRAAGGASGFFVEQALRLGQDPVIDVRRRPANGLGASDLGQAAVVVVSDVALDGEAVRRIQRFVEEGGGLVVALGSRSESTHTALAGAGLVPGPAGSGAGEPGTRIARIASVERTHPWLEPFAGPRSGDFGTARFFRHRKVQTGPEDRILARFDDGDAALVERTVGEGRVLVWTSTFDTYWNDFALQPVFLPFMHQITKSLAGFRPPPTSQIVGDVVDLDSIPELGVTAGAEGGPTISATAPSGRSVEITDVLALDEQGFYALQRDGDEVAVLASNVDVRESDLAALDVEELGAALAPPGETADGVAAGEETPEQTIAEREATQGLWRYLVLGVLLLLVAEVFLANRLSAAG